MTSFLAAQALEVAGDASSFVSLVVALESDRDRAEELGRRALEVVRGNSGSGDRTLEVLRGLFLCATGSAGAGT